jgi:DNA-binding response OmpR family regulator
MRILLIEDEKYIARAVAEVLKKSHYAVDVIHDGSEGLAYAATGVYDVIVLDIMLPGLDGLAILRKLRVSGFATPVILLTARSAVEDKVSGLDAGADDYLPKPFHTEELLARIRALTRRNPGFADEGVLEFCDLRLSPQTLTLNCEDRQVQLSVKAAQLLEFLMVNKGAIISKESILRKLWGFDADVEGNHVEAHVSLLRKALAQAGTKVNIKAVRGLGYRLAESQVEVLSQTRLSVEQASPEQASVEQASETSVRQALTERLPVEQASVEQSSVGQVLARQLPVEQSGRDRFDEVVHDNR